MIKCLLVGDGSSDSFLTHIIEWALNDRFPDHLFTLEFADLRRSRMSTRTLRERINKALELYECDLLFVHRDAENQEVGTRVNEIMEAVESLPAVGSRSTIMVIPIRMTEAWLLFDAEAIRVGANNPNGTMDLNLPSVSRVHTITNPKGTLEQALIKAANLNRRRRKSFRPRKQMHRVAESIDDFSLLRHQESFNHFERQLEMLADLPIFSSDPSI